MKQVFGTAGSRIPVVSIVSKVQQDTTENGKKGNPGVKKEYRAMVNGTGQIPLR